MDEERNNKNIWELVNNSTATAVIEEDTLYDFYEEVWQEAQKKQKEWDLWQMIDILNDDEYTNEVKIYRIRKELKELEDNKNED